MPFRDITDEFRSSVREQETSLPDSKVRKVSKQSVENDILNKSYIAEAYNIVAHLNDLSRMLAGLRAAYLSVDTRTSPLARMGSRNVDIPQDILSWANVRHLSNEERDQIDSQARDILKRCSDRVKEMETLEQRRLALVANKTKSFARLLPERLRRDESSLSLEVIAAHHSSIRWYLSRRLTMASQSQKEMQEERIKRQLERSKSLGSGASRDALTMNVWESSDITTTSSKGSGSWLENTIAATIGVPQNQASIQKPTPLLKESSYISEDEDDDIELSASQILQFEAENANILKNVQHTLESVQQAESRLMDISALQMELVAQLTRQTELTDQLYEDVLTTTSMVEKGNEQLKEARRRTKDGRLFFLVFLIGASFSLLFLHYY